MRYTNIFPNPVDEGFLRFSIDTNPEKHKGYSEHLRFDPIIHLHFIEGKWDLKDGEIIIRFLHNRGGRTKTTVKYQEDEFNWKIDDWDTNEGDYHIEINGKRVKEHIQLVGKSHPLLFCLFMLLDELVKIKDEEIPIYFFLEKRIKNNPGIVDTILKNKPSDVNITRYCYAISYKLWKNKSVEDLRLINEWADKLLSAIGWVNERIKNDGLVKIPWTDEQRIFPIPISAVGGDLLYLESLMNENPKLPSFLSSIPFRKTKSV